MTINKIKYLFALLIVTSLTVSGAVFQNPQTGNAGKPHPKVLPKIESFDIARTFQIKPQELPAPYSTGSARWNLRVIKQLANATLKLPK